MCFSRFKCIYQHDSMECGVACLSMITNYYGIKCDMAKLSDVCSVSKEGVSMLAIRKTAEQVGLDAVSTRVSVNDLTSDVLPCVLHWNQSHFVVLYKVSIKKDVFYIADPAKGKFKCDRRKMEENWISSGSGKGIAMFFQKRKATLGFEKKLSSGKSMSFLWPYIRKYRNYFIQIILGLLLGCLLQLILPFLTQGIVDLGIKHNDVGLIWLIMIGELIIVLGRTTTDFIRRWLLLHISMRVNISLVSDFFIKLLKLPMSFFDTKLMGDLLQRIGDHTRVQDFLTGQALNIIFSFLSFIIFGFVLFLYSIRIFMIFLIGCVCYGLWITIGHKTKRLRLRLVIFDGMVWKCAN